MTSNAHRRYTPASRRRRQPDEPVGPGLGGLDGAVVTSVALLAALGLVMIFSITALQSAERTAPVHFTRHLAALLLGAAVVAATLRIPLGWWRRAAFPLWGVCVALLVLTFAVGVEVNGARRWLSLGPVRMQPAELTKLATLLAVAVLVDQRRTLRHAWRTVMIAGGLCVVPIALLLVQPDFGSAAVIAATVGFVLFVGGVPMRQLLAPAALAIGGAAVYVALRPYAHARWTGFLDPWAVDTREGFQLVQSFVAFGRGGSFGVGLGDGRQKLHFLPEGHTDFILSGVAEELGLLGVACALGAFAALALSGSRIAQRAADPFAALVAFAMTALVVVPAAINAAVVMGLLPTTGFTLPFVSYGGNSLIVCALAVGILLRVGACEAAEAAPRVSGASRRRLARA